MAGSEQVHALMAEIGPILELAAVHGRADDNRWVLTCMDETVLFVEFMADDGRLWLSAEVGTPRAEDRARLYPLMLQVNAQWQKTGGVRLALDGPEGAAILAYDLPLAGLDVPGLCAVIRTLRSMLDGWRTIVARGPAGQAAAAPTARHDATAGVIRG